jgi:outer membrane protein OmpA-like peptidoglycan-associated protein
MRMLSIRLALPFWAVKTFFILLISSALPAISQVERSTAATDYTYRSEPTLIDFRATALLPKAKGEALVNPKQGRTEIDAAFQNLTAPQHFGLEYLTYILWALTPDGRPHNIGEVVPGALNRARLHITTDLQVCALMVTVEPYVAVRQPGKAVMLEKAARPAIERKGEGVEGKYEVSPRGQQDTALARAQADVAEARKAAVRAELEALKARAAAQAAQAQVEAERAARQKAEEEAAVARERAEQVESRISAAASAPEPQQDDGARKAELRLDVLELLNACVPSRDTSRGLAATIASWKFAGAKPSQKALKELAQIADVLKAHPDLHIFVEGHGATPDSTGLAHQRAEAVREALIRRGVSSNAIAPSGVVKSTHTASDREENQQVEIVVSGDALGNIPFWAKISPVGSR